MSPIDLALIVGVTVIAAAVQASAGFGFNIVAVPILTIIDPALTPIPLILANVPFNVMVVQRERASADIRGAALVLLGRLPGTIAGVWLLATADRRFIDGLIAVVVILATVVIGRGLHVRRTVGTRMTAGAIAGVTATASAIGGPPIALLYHGERGPVVRSTLAVIFLGGGLIASTTLWLSGLIGAEQVRLAALVFPGMAIGYLISSRLLRFADGRRLRTATLVVAITAGVTLGIKTLIGA